MIPSDRKYTKEHEWVLTEGDLAVIGITDYAQHALGDIVFVELPEIGSAVAAGGQLAVIESVKAASEAYSTPEGEIAEVNTALEDSPELLNEAPWETWIAKVRFTDLHEEALLDAAAYEALVAEEEAKE